MQVSFLYHFKYSLLHVFSCDLVLGGKDHLLRRLAQVPQFLN